jgi:hypothetical protein
LDVNKELNNDEAATLMSGISSESMQITLDYSKRFTGQITRAWSRKPKRIMSWNQQTCREIVLAKFQHYNNGEKCRSHVYASRAYQCPHAAFDLDVAMNSWSE